MNADTLYEFFWKRFRKDRISLFFSLLGVNNSSRVLDVGGTTYFWDLGEKMGLPVPAVTILNLTVPPGGQKDRYSFVAGDGRQLPFDNNAFDVVFSNSVIEHVGGYDDQRKFAEQIRRVGRGYFVQTPDWRFPVEPHLLTPFVHWLPDSLRCRVNPRYTIRGLLSRLRECEICELRSIKLLRVSDMKALFPDSGVIVERFSLMPKSIIAFRKANVLH